jgi:gamma-glutamyltranspeptidase/glutathione hydrolase
VELALEQPRFHHQWRPEQLKIEKRAGPAVLRELERRGHKLAVVNALGAAQAVGLDSATKAFTGCADPRGDGLARGW